MIDARSAHCMPSALVLKQNPTFWALFWRAGTESILGRRQPSVV